MSRTIAPPRLRKGDLVGVVAPSGPVNVERMQRGVERLSGMFRVRVAPSILAPRDPATPPFLSAPDDVRVAELDAMLGDAEVRAVILAEGGHGLTRVLPRLDASRFRKDPKPVVGFSDGTALLAWAHAAGVRGIHGPTAGRIAIVPEHELEHLVRLLTVPEPLGVRPWQLDGVDGRGVHQGPLLVANLSMAASLIGTPWALPFAGAVAVLEEFGERPFRIDNALTHLATAGELGALAVALIGDLERCTALNETSGATLALATFRAALDRAGVRHAAGAPVGHGARNEALPFGAAARVDFRRKVVEVIEPAVS